MTYGARHGDIEKVEHSEERVEAVARVLHAKLFATITNWQEQMCDWGDLPPEPKRDFLHVARAALSVIPLPVGGDGEVERLRRALRVLKNVLAQETRIDTSTWQHIAEEALQHSVPSVGGDGEVELPSIEAEGERIAAETWRHPSGNYLWTDLVGAIQTAIAEERARHIGEPGL